MSQLKELEARYQDIVDNHPPEEVFALLVILGEHLATQYPEHVVIALSNLVTDIVKTPPELLEQHPEAGFGLALIAAMERASNELGEPPNDQVH